MMKTRDNDRENDERVKKWLETPESLKLLSRVAGVIAKRSKIMGFGNCFSIPEGFPNESEEELVSEIRSCLVEFLLTRPKIQFALVNSGFMNIERFLSTAFINFRIDKMRNKETDLRRYLRKRLLTVIRNSEAIFHKKTGATVLVGRNPDKKTEMVLFDDDLEKIPFPVDEVGGAGIDSIKGKKKLIFLSLHFLDHLERSGGRPVFTDLRNLVQWIMMHVSPETARPAEIPAGENFEAIPDNRHRPDQFFFDAKRIEKWAVLFSNRLDAPDANLFRLRYCRENTLEEAAEATGFKSPSSARNHLKRSEKKLEMFLSDLPGLTPEDLNETAFAFFRKSLCQILEDRFSGNV